MSNILTSPENTENLFERNLPVGGWGGGWGGTETEGAREARRAWKSEHGWTQIRGGQPLTASYSLTLVLLHLLLVRGVRCSVTSVIAE